jgi:hypothetical protein
VFNGRGTSEGQAQPTGLKSGLGMDGWDGVEDWIRERWIMMEIGKRQPM